MKLRLSETNRTVKSVFASRHSQKDQNIEPEVEIEQDILGDCRGIQENLTTNLQMTSMHDNTHDAKYKT